MLRADIAETRLEPNSQMYAVIIGYMARVGTETPIVCRETALADSMQFNIYKGGIDKNSHNRRQEHIP